MTHLDHLAALVLVVVFPLYATRAYRRFRRDVQARAGAARLREYAVTMWIEWSLVVLTLALWVQAGRPWSGLGFQVPLRTGSAVGLGITLLGLGFLAIQWRGITRLDDATRARVREQLGPAADLMPRTAQEHRWFRALAVTAGICEEVLYRGYLIAYASAFLPGWVAAIATGVVFGLAHWYQGRDGIVKTGVVGVAAGLLYVGTGSLLWPVLLHATIDLQGGAVGRLVLATDRVTPPAS